MIQDIIEMLYEIGFVILSRTEDTFLMSNGDIKLSFTREHKFDSFNLEVVDG